MISNIGSPAPSSAHQYVKPLFGCHECVHWYTLEVCNVFRVRLSCRYFQKQLDICLTECPFLKLSIILEKYYLINMGDSFFLNTT